MSTEIAERATCPRPPRKVNRTTTVTTDDKTMERINNLKAGRSINVTYVNDLVSSSRGTQGASHYMLRRVNLLRRQHAGGWDTIKVRSRRGNEVACRIVDQVFGVSDACTGVVRVERIVNGGNAEKEG